MLMINSMQGRGSIAEQSNFDTNLDSKTNGLSNRLATGSDTNNKV